MKKYPDLFTNMPGLIHGGDYNPDQWLEYPEILNEDVRLMKLAGVNSATVAIFAWAALEPEEGVYRFEWLDAVMDRLWANGVSVILATPSGARPAWMDKKYPEILRTREDRTKNLHGVRHNHCMTSPIYREKVAKMNRMLAQRYKGHPALAMWHISNEYSGECHCPLCQEAFREWLKKKYHGDIDELNRQWWTAFWSHKYTSFDQIESPSSKGEPLVHGMNLDWRRFVTDQTISFMENEIAPLREITPNIPLTTNFMRLHYELDYWKMAPYLDRISWDSYPGWHEEGSTTAQVAAFTGFVHDLSRSFKGGKPFMVMESTPSLVNWQGVNKLKRPGMHLLSSVQAIAHGSDSVQYFQWRKSRGATEKFHGAVVDHYGGSDTRVFKDVSQVGETLKRLEKVAGTSVRPEAAVLFDWENRWAIADFQGLYNGSFERGYSDEAVAHYTPLWKRGVPCDVVSEDSDFSGYKLLSMPMMYMLRPGVAKRLTDFAQAGGTLVLTYMAGYVNENDLCYLGGFPGDGLGAAAGVWAEEIDTVYPSDKNEAVFSEPFGKMKDRYELGQVRELIHALPGTEVLARYGADFYKDRPVLTRKKVGKGWIYYIAARTGQDFLDDFYATILEEAGVTPALPVTLPEGVSMTLREGDGERYIFLMNFSEEEKRVVLPEGHTLSDVQTGEEVRETVTLPVYGVLVLSEASEEK